MALQFHPDKNRAPGADEAFKAVSRAFSCLSDPQKRAEYDRFGHEDGLAAASGVRFRHTAGNPFEGEISPEELFNMFFGGAGPGGGGGATFHFSMGGGHPFGPLFAQHFAHFAGGADHPHRRPRYPRGAQGLGRRHGEHPGNLIAFLLQVIPIVIVAVIMYLANLAQSAPEAADQPWQGFAQFVSLKQDSRYFPAGPYHTANLRVPYYASRQFEAHFAPSRDRAALSREQDRLRARFEEAIEKHYLGDLQKQCRLELDELARRRAASQDDPEVLRELHGKTCPSCEELYRLDPASRK